MIARGHVTGLHRGMLRLRAPALRLGDVVRLGERGEMSARVCELDESGALAVPAQSCAGIGLGTAVRVERAGDVLALGTCVFGHAIDARGTVLCGTPVHGPRVPIRKRSRSPQERKAIGVPFWTGVRAIDGLLTFGRGARIGIFGAPGCGKSTLIEQIVAGGRTDAVVVALVGERGREAQRWFNTIDARTTIVCATSDRSAIERVRAAEVAAAQSLALCRRGLHVVLLLDSLARYAAALREIDVAAGEIAGRGGYPASVFANLARLAEIAGNFHDGSITLVASVLDDGDERDPVSDAARSLLDGHIALSTRLAGEGRFPAIDVLRSASRTMASVATADHVRDAAAVRRALALLERTADARALGIESTDQTVRAVTAAEERIVSFLTQDAHASAPGETLESMRAAVAGL